MILGPGFELEAHKDKTRNIYRSGRRKRFLAWRERMNGLFRFSTNPT